MQKKLVTEFPEFLRRILLDLLPEALDAFKQKEDVAPFMHVFSIAEKKHCAVPIQSKNGTTKDRTVEMVKIVVEELQADLVISLFEAWMVSVKKEDEEAFDAQELPSENPNRVSALICTVETHTETWMGILQENSDVVLETLEFIKSGGMSEGRFSNLLRANVTLH